MTILGSSLASPEDSLSRPSPEPPSSGGVPAVLLGQNEDTRLLLRGLLRLHRYPVLHEVGTVDELVALPSLPAPTVLVVDVESVWEGWDRELPSALILHPELRVLVLLPPESAALEPRARAAGATRVVVRPFAIRDFVRAVAATARGPFPSSPRPPP